MSADYGNKRIAVFKSPGVSRRDPGGGAEQVAVSNRTGAVYVRSGQEGW